jgi:hypothetical protein
MKRVQPLESTSLKMPRQYAKINRNKTAIASKAGQPAGGGSEHDNGSALEAKAQPIARFLTDE